MNTLSAMILIACWISIGLLLASTIPARQSKEMMNLLESKKKVLQAKTACDTMFLDADYKDSVLTLPEGVREEGDRLRVGKYSYECVGSMIPGKGGVTVITEKRWLK